MPPSPLEIIGKFFANYGLIPTQGFPAFQQAQGPLLSTDLITEVNNFGEPTQYQGPSGYFQSLGDWSRFFSTGSDFAVHLPDAPRADGAYEARLSGTIHLTRDGKVSEVAPDQHHWTETFVLDDSGHIKRLNVTMNLSPSL